MEYDYERCSWEVSYVCEDCDKEYWSTRTQNRKQTDESAKRRLMVHLRHCEKANAPKVKESIKASNTRGYCNCPVCNQVTRADRLVEHCHSKHKDELSFSMDDAIRKEMRDLHLPVLWGFEPYPKSKRGAKSVFVCLHCKKGSFTHTKRSADFAVTPAKLLHTHKDCIEHFEPYSHYFEDTTEPPTLLPFVCKKYLESELKAILAGEKPAEASSPVLEVKEPEKEYETSLRILEFKEENARLKAQLEEERKKKLLSETVKEQLIEIVEPDEDLGDEDLIEKAVREYKKIQRRKTIADDKYAKMLETMRDAKDALQNLLSADEDIYELIRRSCTKEQVHALETILKTT